MLSVEEELIDRITATFHSLRIGKVPPPIPIPDDLPDNEVRQLITFVNRFIVEFASFTEALGQVAQGELDTRPLLGSMAVVHSFKALQSNLRHLTWKTQQVAGGDLEQQVDFMGDFSAAFNSMTQQLKDSQEQLERRNRFIRETFGRYTSDDIVGLLLDVPEGLKLGGEKREITLLMSDLRGFTALVERLEPTVVVAMLNHYLSAMVEIIQKNHGTIDEIIGDAIFVLFGAPLAMADSARRGVRCALEMQKAMIEVNEYNLRQGWPEIEMGIALHNGEVVVGNIGSIKRSKYGVVGRAVNLAARIESFTIGGQILVSPALISAAGQGLILGEEVEVHAKGMREPLRCRDLQGHEDYPEFKLEEEEIILATLVRPLPCSYLVLAGKHLDGPMQPAALISLSHRRALVEVDCQLPPRANLMLRLKGGGDDKDSLEFYAKVLHPVDESIPNYLIHFTSLPPAVRERLQRLIEESQGS